MNERDKDYFRERVGREMAEDLKVPALRAPEALAAACRILAYEGHESGLAGQVTARGEGPGTWWTLQFGYGFDEATPERIAHMDSSMLYGTAHLPEWPGVPVADDEGRIISSALGEAKTLLLANHGLLAAGTSIEEATYLAVFMERAARMQLLAAAAGGVKDVKPELAQEARDFLLQPSIVRGTFAYWARRAA